ncbi:glycosyltransferase family 25 protein [Sciscionella marina]|uniref:glycosyltransferase family 25 protein n=1 Tax=Sciscionella marina TaxID=508770 RepID=UPI00036786D9|nr:glycosyltransferase family 25 protein [Sciscionella marina]
MATTIRTYVINLTRRSDRRSEISRTIPAELAPQFTSDWDTSFDGLDITADELKARGVRCFPWQIESDNPWWSRPLKYGEIGCTLAHLACWHDAAEHDADWTLILEDDAIVGPNFATNLHDTLEMTAAHSAADFIYLGRYKLDPDRPAILGYVHPGYSHCSFAYLLSRSGLDTVLDAGLDQAIIPVDEYLPTLYINHPRQDVQDRYPNQNLPTLACEPPLVQQRPKDEAGSDTEDSPFFTPA